jgi:cytochrome c-type biogenesis protein CcmH/NrfG
MAPDVIEFRQHAALVLVGLKRLPEATARLRQAVILQPADLNVRRDLALLLERQGASREAAEQYQEILKLAPQDADARSRLEALPGSPMNPSR